MRVVSLVPSVTEIIISLGRVKNLVGVSHSCILPEGINLPVLTSTFVDTYASSFDIDTKVKESYKEGIPLYKLDPKKLVSLKPDLVITQSSCEVCALPENEVINIVNKYLPGTKVVTISPVTLGEIIDSIFYLGNLLDAEESAKCKVEEIKETFSKIKERTKDVKRKRVVYVEWIDPLMVGGNWLSELIEMGGGISVGSPEPGSFSVYTTLEKIISESPDCFLIAPCGFGLEKSLREAENLLPLLREYSEVVIADGDTYFNSPSTKIKESAEIVAHSLYPNLFPDFEYVLEFYKKFPRVT